VAKDKGFYSRRGLDVRIRHAGPTRLPVQELTSGRADFTTAFLTSALHYRDRGVPLVNVAQVVNRSSLMLVAWKGEGVRSLQDLQGRKVSIWEGDYRAPFLGVFAAHHVTPVVYPQYYSVSLFLRRGVSACSAMYYNEYHMLYQSGVDPEEVTTFFLRDHGYDVPEDGVYCLESFRRARPTVCASFREATLEGWGYARDHPEEALRLVMQYVTAGHVPTNATHMRWMLTAILPCIVPGAGARWQLGELSRTDYEKCVTLMKAQRLIVRAPTYEAFCGRGNPNAP
jgi:NitT/TauT family transport system substrate-binding protein